MTSNNSNQAFNHSDGNNSMFPLNIDLSDDTKSVTDIFVNAVKVLCGSPNSSHKVFETDKGNFIVANDTKRCKGHCRNPDSFAICGKQVNCSNFSNARKVAEKINNEKNHFE